MFYVDEEHGGLHALQRWVVCAGERPAGEGAAGEGGAAWEPRRVCDDHSACGWEVACGARDDAAEVEPPDDAECGGVSLHAVGV